jgi:hypothetical protein
VYESYICTLLKYPWHAIEHVILDERDRLFQTAVVLTKHLILTIRKYDNKKNDDHKSGLYTSRKYNSKDNLDHKKGLPTISTLQEFVIAVLTCPGFAEGQKAFYINFVNQGGFGHMCNDRAVSVKFGGTSHVSSLWPFLVLVRDPKTDDQMVNVSAQNLYMTQHFS